MPRKNKMKIDEMFDVISASQKDALRGIGPKDKRPQASLYDILGENELEVYGEETKTKKTKSKYEKKGTRNWLKTRASGMSEYLTDPVDVWDATHFFYYFKKCFQNKYKNSAYDLTLRAGVTMMKSLKNRFANDFKEKPLNPLMVRDYIDWFFSHESAKMEKDDRDFYVHAILQKRIVKNFLSQYKKAVLIQDETPDEVSFDGIDNAFAASRIGFMMTYGVVIVFNWLMTKKGKNETEAKNIVMAILKDTMKEGEQSLGRIVSSTKRFSPYPVDYCKRELTSVLDSLKVKATDVIFSESAQLRI